VYVKEEAAEAEKKRKRDRDGEQCILCVYGRKTEMEGIGTKIKQETRPQRELHRAEKLKEES